MNQRPCGDFGFQRFFELLRNFSGGLFCSRIEGAGLQIGQASASKACRALDDVFVVKGVKTQEALEGC